MPRLIRAGYTPAFDSILAAEFTLVHDVQSATKFDLHLKINFTDGVPEDFERMIRRGAIRGRLHNEATGETWNLFRSTGGAIESPYFCRKTT